MLLRRTSNLDLSSAVRVLLLRIEPDSSPPAAEVSGTAEAASWASAIMPKTIRQLLTEASSNPRYVRLHNASYSARELLGEIMSMASRIVRRVSEAQMASNDQRWWPIREIASKWDSIRAYPEMLQDADAELLKILVLDAYADLERLEGR